METLFNTTADNHDPYEGMTQKQIRAAKASWLRLNKSLDRLDAYILSCPSMVKAYIDKHPLQQKSTDFFAERVRLDKEILLSIFKQQCHITIRAYQYQKRMEAAAAMLQAGKLNHKQIARRCGYQNVKNFSRAFKKVYKRTPQQYLLTIRSKTNRI